MRESQGNYNICTFHTGVPDRWGYMRRGWGTCAGERERGRIFISFKLIYTEKYSENNIKGCMMQKQA